MNSSRKRIYGAFMVGLGLVAGAFILSQYSHVFFSSSASQTANAVIVPERKHIPVADSDADNIPDWQDAFLSEEPFILPTAEDAENYEYPTSLTGQFGIKFFKEVFLASEYGVLDQSQDKFVEEALKRLAVRARDVLYTKSDIEVIDSNDPELLHAYGNLIALIALSHPITVDNEMEILKRAATNNDPEALKDLETIRIAYEQMTQKMLEVTVPEKYAQHHLNLTNAYNAVYEDILGFEKLFDDPLYALLRYKRYEDDVLGMGNAITQLYDTLYLQDDIRWTGNDAVLRFVAFEE